MYIQWRGPIVGRSVSHIWSSFGWCLFLEFGQLSEGEVSSNGELGNPKGEWTLTTMESWPIWTIQVGGRVQATSENSRNVRERALRSLIGHRLRSLEIDTASPSTRLTFSMGLMLTTERSARQHCQAHWLLRCPEGGDWPFVFPKGTHANWRQLPSETTAPPQASTVSR